MIWTGSPKLWYQPTNIKKLLGSPYRSIVHWRCTCPKRKLLWLWFGCHVLWGNSANGTKCSSPRLSIPKEKSSVRCQGAAKDPHLLILWNQSLLLFTILFPFIKISYTINYPILFIFYIYYNYIIYYNFYSIFNISF